MNLLEKIDRALKWSFYALFFLTPLILYPKTFELFEFNKMWFAYAVSLLILFLWVSKMIISEKFLCKRTPFDIPLMLFLASQTISTAFSIDPHVSFWGYYSRFNGGLLSIITYIFLYYAFVSNFITAKKDSGFFENISYKMLIASLFSGTAVALWGFTSHFGYDLTCLMFRGELNVACWTDAFQPTVRLFSTLGQPNWLASYFSILIPIALSIGILKLASYLEKNNPSSIKNTFTSKKFLVPISYFLFSTLLFIEVLWTASQSGYLGIISGLTVFTGGFILFVYKKSPLKKLEFKILASVLVIFFSISFFMGNPLANRFSFLSIYGFINTTSINQENTKEVKSETLAIPALEGGGSDSGKIRTIVWTGALEIFKRYPIFGSGVETFAYSYYKVKPVEHNLLSEWDYLYNKAHNEYLNYLSTTGLVGLGTYLLFIFWFLFYAIKKTLKEQNLSIKIIELGLISSFTTILVSNFFGFSVVMINLYMFIIPALFLGVRGSKTDDVSEKELTPIKYISLFILGCVCLYFVFYLLKYWTADQEYNLGYNLQKVQEYVQANTHLTAAAKLVPDEPIYKDELASNLATLSYLLYSQDQATQAAIFSDQAITLSNEVTKKYPHNLTFYKTRVRLFFTLAQADPAYLTDAIKAVEQAKFLAPTDAKVSYNAGLLYGQKGDLDKAISELHHTLELKPNYRDPRVALASFYKEKADKELDMSKRQEYLQNAKKELEFVLKNIAPNDPQVKELLNSIK